MEPHDLPESDEALYAFHSGAPGQEAYERAFAEVVDRLAARIGREVELAQVESPRRLPAARPQKLVSAWSDALVAQAEREPRVVALDGDLRLDTGLVAFQNRFPDRFFECGIAEQDMVSQAGTMALAGLVPVVHSFACFMTTRANEQIFNNATEGTKVIYHGSLAGVVPGGPGHSHQSVRDIALMGSVPGMAAIEPYCEQEVEFALDWAVRQARGPVYVRLVTPPWELGFEPPSAAELVPGRGTVLRDGEDGAFVCTGPVLVSQARQACDALAREGVVFGLVALPWLRGVDGAWLARAIPDGPIVCVDNHVAAGGQGAAVLEALARAAPDAAGRVVQIAIDGVPVCGSNDEVLAHHGLDARGLAARALEAVPLRAPA
jgi:transketolase